MGICVSSGGLEASCFQIPWQVIFVELAPSSHLLNSSGHLANTEQKRVNCVFIYTYSFSLPLPRRAVNELS